MIRKVLNVSLCVSIVVLQFVFWRLPGDDTFFADAIEHMGSLRHSSPLWEYVADLYGHIMQFFFVAIPSMLHVLHLPRVGLLCQDNIDSLRAFLHCNLSPLDQYNETACSIDIDKEAIDTLFKYMTHFDMMALAISLVIVNFPGYDLLRGFKAAVGEDI